MSKFDKTGVMIREKDELSLSTLGADIVLKFQQLSFTDGFRMLKSNLFLDVAGLTAGEGQGLKLGLASSNLSPTEIKEALEVNGPIFRGQRTEKEQARRPVWLVAGLRNLDPSATQASFVSENGGTMIVVKPQWTFPKGSPYVWFIYNRGGALTSGAVCSLSGTHFGVWVD